VVIVLNSNETKHFPFIFYGGKNQISFPRDTRKFPCQLGNALIWLVGIRGKTPRC